METELWHGYLGTAGRKGRQQTNQTYGHRATSRLYRRARGDRAYRPEATRHGWPLCGMRAVPSSRQALRIKCVFVTQPRSNLLGVWICVFRFIAVEKPATGAGVEFFESGILEEVEISQEPLHSCAGTSTT